MSRRPAKQIAEGVFQHADGSFTVRVKARGVDSEQHFDIGSSMRAMTDWQDRERGRLKSDRPPPAKGTLAKDVVRFIATLPDTIAGDEEGTRTARALRRERQHQLDWWIEQFPPTQRRTAIDGPMIQSRLNGLRGIRSASTCNHYREALYQLWRALDGEDAANPVRSVPRFEEPEPEPREIPARLVRRIFDAMPNLGRSEKDRKRSGVSLGKIRLELEYEAGLSPAEIMRIRPTDPDLANGTLYVRRRRKGKGVDGMTMPLTARAQMVLRRFIAAHAFGRYSTRGAAQMFDRGVKTVLKAEDLSTTDRAILARARPYDFRHCFATRAMRDTNNLKTTQELLRHRSSKTTKRYAHAAVPEHLRRAIAQMDEADRGDAPAAKTGSD